ncbi:MAG: isoprenylcysteine carboxyl methyltransferase [Caulobacteraceae bacterium]|nr:isoprenylcysteine carboxyl methyltransferase [Caulobacteraceae bacterium]
MTPLRATLDLWGLWAVSWGVAAIWSRRTVGRPRGIGGSAHYLPTLLGAALLFAPPLAGFGHRLWRLPQPIAWALCAATIASFAFAWWARLWLGSLWSGSITRKEGHRVVEGGPFRLVRHPIYTGIIAASFLLATELGTPAAVAGAAVLTLGWWMKAREEERFLIQELGPAYDDYRRRTPMLVPFLGRRR